MTTENNQLDDDGMMTADAFMALINEMGDWVGDIAEMHDKFGVNAVIRHLPKEQLLTFLKFRLDFLQEEIDEMKLAYDSFAAGTGTLKDADEVVDALIDLSVVAIGTLDAFEVDAYTAWTRVWDANMEKEPGVNPNRPNPLGLPDMIKPAGWTAPSHADNIGLLDKLL